MEAESADATLDAFDFALPPECIAQEPAEPRDAARLLVLDRETGGLRDGHVRDLPDLLRAGDCRRNREIRRDRRPSWNLGLGFWIDRVPHPFAAALSGERVGVSPGAPSFRRSPERRKGGGRAPSTSDPPFAQSCEGWGTRAPQPNPKAKIQNPKSHHRISLANAQAA